jgi:hypothetical protein
MKRSTWILLAVLGLLIVATLLVFQRPGETSSSGLLGETLVFIDSAAIDKIQITSSSGEVSLVREGARWMLSSPRHYPADENAVTAAVGAASRLELRSLVSSNPGKQHLFQVDSSGTLVRLFDHRAERAAFRVGKVDGSYTGTYVRQEGSNDVYLADGVITHLFNGDAENWRDKSIITAKKEEIRSVGFQYGGDTTFTLVQQDSVWRIEGIPAVGPAVESFLGYLSTLAADAFVDSGITLQDPIALLQVDGTRVSFHPTGAGNKYHVRTSAGPQVFEVYKWRVSQLLKRKEDFLGSTNQ